ncbi:MAG TPA: hypothetical protein PLC53_01470 [Bacilli bacterium]|nr:hypothetical protein [Bacilli bacterium]
MVKHGDAKRVKSKILKKIPDEDYKQEVNPSSFRIYGNVGQVGTLFEVFIPNPIDFRSLGYDKSEKICIKLLYPNKNLIVITSSAGFIKLTNLDVCIYKKNSIPSEELDKIIKGDSHSLSSGILKANIPVTDTRHLNELPYSLALNDRYFFDLFYGDNIYDFTNSELLESYLFHSDYEEVDISNMNINDIPLFASFIMDNYGLVLDEEGLDGIRLFEAGDSVAALFKDTESNALLLGWDLAGENEQYYAIISKDKSLVQTTVKDGDFVYKVFTYDDGSVRRTRIEESHTNKDRLLRNCTRTSNKFYKIGGIPLMEALDPNCLKAYLGQSNKVKKKLIN